MSATTLLCHDILQYVINSGTKYSIAEKINGIAASQMDTNRLLMWAVRGKKPPVIMLPDYIHEEFKAFLSGRLRELAVILHTCFLAVCLGSSCY